MPHRLCLLTALAYYVEPMAVLTRTQQLFVRRVGKLSEQRFVHWLCDRDVGNTVPEEVQVFLRNQEICSDESFTNRVSSSVCFTF